MQNNGCGHIQVSAFTSNQTTENFSKIILTTDDDGAISLHGMKPHLAALDNHLSIKIADLENQLKNIKANIFIINQKISLLGAEISNNKTTLANENDSIKKMDLYYKGYALEEKLNIMISEKSNFEFKNMEYSNQLKIFETAQEKNDKQTMIFESKNFSSSYHWSAVQTPVSPSAIVTDNPSGQSPSILASLSAAITWAIAKLNLKSGSQNTVLPPTEPAILDATPISTIAKFPLPSQPRYSS